MTKTDFHAEPFDEGTKTKLALFEAYLREWLPPFVMRPPLPAPIKIVDFFAGPGRDSADQPGSPLIAWREIEGQAEQLRTKARPPVRLILNEKVRSKYRRLKSLMDELAIPPTVCDWTVENLEFEKAFERFLPELLSGNNFLFLDQSGMKFITPEVLTRIVELPSTDFLFFIASSSIRRFADQPAFRTYLDLSKKNFSATSFSDTHRNIVAYYRSLIPAERKYYLAPFSLKKRSNLYGLIFGSQHPFGIEKFLQVCWRIDPHTGEANFDIDADRPDREQPSLFSDMDRAGKGVDFEQRLKRRILTGEIVDDRSVYLASLEEGFLPKHGRVVLKGLIRDKIVAMTNAGERPRVSRMSYTSPRRFEVTTDG